MNGKLQKFTEKNRMLRAENRDLASTIDDLSGRHNPSILRNFIGMAVKNGTAYGWTRLYVYLQQTMTWFPKTVPVDIILGVSGQSVTAFFDGPVSSVLSDVFDGIAEGGFGRMATMHQLVESEVAGTVCLLVPGAAAANGENNNAGGNANTGS